MKNIYRVVFLFFAVVLNAQENPRSIKDSISAAHWDSHNLDFDSLANPQLSAIEFEPQDTIIIKEGIVIPHLSEDIPVTPFNLVHFKEEKKWFFYGQNNLVFNQASFTNWNSGGNNNIGILGKINYNLSYKNRRHFWDNNVQLGYGFVSNSGQSTRKTEDFINFLTNYGYELGGHYFLSAGFQFLSQFTPGYNYALTPAPHFDDRISRFMSPAYVNLGLGVSYNPNEDFQLIVRPVSGKFTIVNDPLLQKAGRYGLEYDGQSLRKELGAMANVLFRLKIYKDINLVNQLNLFSNYLESPERVDIGYNGILNFKVNRFISTLISFDVLYDHDQIQRTQLKQTLGVGFIYNFDKDANFKTTTRNRDWRAPR